MEWTTAADIRRKLQACWERGEVLATQFHDAPLFPLSIRLRKPNAQALSDRFDNVRKWIRELEDGSKAGQGFGYEIEWIEINHRRLGRNRLPARVVIPTENDLLRLIDKDHQAERFRNLSEATLKHFPVLRDWL